MNEVVKISEEWLVTKHSNTSIFYRVWSPLQSIPTATIVFLHGFGEHTGRYLKNFEKFAQAGIKVVAFDQRGHGETGKKINSLGTGSDLSTLFKDIDEFIEKFYDPSVNLILMGFSCGGLASFNYAINGSKRNLLNGLIGCSPGFKLSAGPPNSVVLFTLRNLAKVIPNYTFKLEIDASCLSRDEEVVQQYIKDPLVTSRCSVAYLNEALVQGYIQSNANKIQIKNILITHGTADKSALPEGSQEMYELLKQNTEYATLKLYNDGYHELHNDLCREKVLNDYIHWINNLDPALIQSKF
ncbi:alpha/beta-hydrolase [Conidiobolus coronatus NRRL 28638]|uniref:Alpha/beta-hydrolase n=1 Tax=Conidiobolus coronatus (strain ATCC 28846 / CBS 209.66 / NRRL 28638) TaxID=796925 RepID=A0A137PHK9_CONC2|nr:alpha/beta-hydrolase [Conidiobolus coronatus NRRL 28638]|eukprot:KXN74487.1 alpha/beta-hydrolase [Conidiobolus coronatus NRRL 28638]